MKKIFNTFRYVILGILLVLFVISLFSCNDWNESQDIDYFQSTINIYSYSSNYYSYIP